MWGYQRRQPILALYFESLTLEPNPIEWPSSLLGNPGILDLSYNYFKIRATMFSKPTFFFPNTFNEFVLFIFPKLEIRKPYNLDPLSENLYHNEF